MGIATPVRGQQQQPEVWELGWKRERIVLTVNNVRGVCSQCWWLVVS